MFHFPTFPPHTLCVQMRVTRHDSCWVSPFGHPRITARLPTPQGLSQAPTSFIGSWCQGIHHVPFVACLNNVKTTHATKDARVHYADLKQQPHQHHPPTTQQTDSKGRNRTTNHHTLTCMTPDPSGPNSVPNNQPNQTTKPVPLPHQNRGCTKHSTTQPGSLHRRFH